MSKITPIKTRLRNTLFGVIFAILSSFGLNLALSFSTPVIATNSQPVAELSSEETSLDNLIADVEAEEVTDASVSEAEATDTCYDQLGAIAWLVCPSSGVLGKAIDSIYGLIEELLIVNPMTFDDSSPVYNVWQVMRDITNIVFVIALLIVVYSQITGLGINNYGVKKVLPKLVVSAVLINLSYFLCAIFVDISNIVGGSIGGLFDSIQAQAIASGGLGDASGVTWTTLTAALIGGGSVLGLGVATIASGLGGFLWPLLGTLIGGILSVLVGLVTLGLRQALISMLVMIAPLAFVAYLLPNTESWFKKWKDTFASMLIFYPMFSLLFGASKLAGWALIANAVSSGKVFGIILGMAVQVFPLFASISLMKMSSTILGKISSKLDSLADKPRGLAKDWAGSHAELSRLRHINHSQAPSAGIRRFLDRSRTLREENIKNETATRTGRGLIYAQRSILGTQKYKPEELKQDLKATRSTRGAKVASNVTMELQTATEDKEHVLNNYGDYYKATKRDKALADQSLQDFFESTRSSLSLVNDNEADIDYLAGEWVKIANKGHDSYEYKHFIRGAAGALGEKGTESVLAQVISKAATNEARHRRDTHILMSKFKYNKSDARNMLVGYYVNDNGLAVDKAGNELEKIPGFLLKRDPGKLVPYDKFDENGRAYYDMIDQDGKFISRVYKDDSAAIKEIFSEFDMPINDPINGLYGILAGHAEGETYVGDNKKAVVLPTVGLAKYRTTIGRAILSSHFKEKAAFAGPMYATQVMNGEIKDYAHNFIARLDNLDKTGKAGNFNTQDAFEFGQLKMLMDPKEWPVLFPEDSLRTFRNVNGELMKATAAKKDDNGNFALDKEGHKIFENDNNRIARNNPEDGDVEELRRTLINKFLSPNSKKFTSMLSRYTQGTADNQKPGTAEPIRKLVENLESWTDKDVLEFLQKNFTGAPKSLGDPFAEQTDNFVYTSKEIRDKILPRKPKGAYDKNDPASSSTIVDSHNDEDSFGSKKHPIGLHSSSDPNHPQSLGGVLEHIDELYFSASDGDPRAFAEEVMDYLDSEPFLEGCANDFSEVTFANPDASVDELHNELVDIISARLSEY